MVYGALFGKMISGDPRWNRIKKNYLSSEYTVEDAAEFHSGIMENVADGSAWDYVNTKDPNFLEMLWRFRHDETCFRVPIFLPYIRKYFRNCNPTDESKQVDVSKLLCFLLDTTEKKKGVLLSPITFVDQTRIMSILEELGLELPSSIDGRVYESIRRNSIIDVETLTEKNEIRKKLMVFGNRVRIIQHYFYETKSEITITRLLGKLLTRIRWIYFASSQIMMSNRSFIE